MAPRKWFKNWIVNRFARSTSWIEIKTSAEDFCYLRIDIAVKWLGQNFYHLVRESRYNIKLNFDLYFELASIILIYAPTGDLWVLFV